jgi:Chromo (CHRromatin Organisation MOdifier) domain
MPPFELALSRPPPTLSLQVSPRPEEFSPKTLKREFLERLKTLRLRAGVNLHKAQARYKRNYDRGVYPKNTGLTEGDEAYVRVEVTETGRNHKLESLMQGPYRVVENAGTTFRLQMGDEVVRVSSDRVTRAPSPVAPDTEPRSPVSPESISPPTLAEERSQASPLGIRTESPSLTGPVTTTSPTETPLQDPPPSGPSTDPGASSASNLGRAPTPILSRHNPGDHPRRSGRRVRFTLPRQAPSDLPLRVEPRQPRRSREEPPPGGREYVVEKLVGAANGEGGQHLYRVRWWGYDPEEDSWEPAEQLPAHFIRRYWRSRRLSTPPMGAY